MSEKGLSNSRGTWKLLVVVAGMFGNVLNLRHLAHLVGTDRRFYGLQARGAFCTYCPCRYISAACSRC